MSEKIDIIFLRSTIGCYIPYSGMGIFKNEKIWFLRETESEIYHAWYVSDEEYKKYEEEHISMCEKTGIPFDYRNDIASINNFKGVIYYSEKCPKREKDFTFEKTKFLSFRE